MGESRRGPLGLLERTKKLIVQVLRPSRGSEVNHHSFSSERLGSEVGEVFVETRFQPEVTHLVSCRRGELVQLSGAVRFLRVPSYG